jgi:glutamate carboxypeptidase
VNTIRDLSDALLLTEKITALSSGSLNPSGVLSVQHALAEILQSAGFSVAWQNPAIDGGAPLLVAEFPGQRLEWMTFISHADTLDHGHGLSQKIEVRREDDRLVAPGVLDDKASQVVGLWGILQFLRKFPKPQRGIRFLSSPNEELGSPGFHDFYSQISLSSHFALGLEPAYQGRDIVQERRGNRWYDVEILGTEAHSGRDPEKGRSALHDLCLKVPKLVKLNRPSVGVSLNVGEITSDNPTYNLVAGRATAKIDLRFLDIKRRNRSHKKIDRILKKSFLKPLQGAPGTRTRYKIVDDCPPLKVNRESRIHAADYVRILRELEQNPKIQAVRSGGAADVSYMARKKLVVLDGLGACGGNMHRVDEFVRIPSLETRAQALFEFLSLIEKNE